MSQKRPDIQGLRCICILMVLLYHYYPRIFPQGRLGVDMFFVISGFLIALMLSKKKNGVAEYFLQFYWRRVKRILPLCYLVFLLSYITMYILKLEIFVSINKNFGVKALCFMANVKISEEDQYEAQLTGATVLLTHYWSLSTEIQFYFLAPMIVLCVLKQSTKRKNVFFAFLSSISLLHYVTTSETIAFNSPLARLWQFMAGFIAYYNCSDDKAYAPLMIDTGDEKKAMLHNIEKSFEEDEKPFVKITKSHLLSYFSLFIVCSIVFIPSPTFFLDTLFRVIVTLSTMWTLMAVGKNPKFLEHPWAVYMGDISFALYLVHWPILCFVKAFAMTDSCVTTLAIPTAFSLSMMLAVFLHKTFEKRYLQWGTTCNVIVIVTLIVGCSAMVFINFEKADSLPLATEDFFENAIRRNHDLNVAKKGLTEHMTSKYSKPFVLEGFDEERSTNKLSLIEGGTGNLTILIIGNSYTGNHADIIFEGLEGLHNKVYTYWTDGCESLLPTVRFEKYFGCVKKQPMQHAQLLEMLKPDLLFIVERGYAIKNNFTSDYILEDQYMQEVTNNLDVYQKFTKRIFILGPIPKLPTGAIVKALEYLKMKQRLKDSPPFFVDDTLNQRIRLRKIASVCRKCVVYEWEHVFYNNTSQFIPYNPETDLFLFDNTGHLGEEGLEKMKPFYQNMGREIEWMRERNLLLM